MHLCDRLQMRWLAILLVLAGAMLTGCATGDAAHTDASARLERLAQRPSIDRGSKDAPPPPGLNIDAMTPVALDNAVARRSAEEALANVDSPEVIGADPDNRPPSAATPKSVLHYISGRSLLLGGDLQGALVELEAAAKSDPTAAEPWRDIGQTQRRLGDRLSAAAAYRQALRLDPDDLESLIQVGLWSLQRRDPESAAAMLAHARTQALTVDDSALMFVIDFNLGQAMLQLGELRAGIELLSAGLDLPSTLDSPTAYRNELELLFRQRGDAWRDVGDAAMQLEDYDVALNAYENAAALPTLDPAGLLPRLTYAAMRSGQAARAALAILDALAAGSDLAGDRVLPLIRYVGANSSVGPLLRDAIDERRDALTPDEQRRLGSLYTRAAAAALPAPAAAAVLRDRLATHPSDTGALRDLYRLEDNDPKAMVAETLRLIAQAPMNERRYADSLIVAATSVEELEPHIDPQSSLAAAILEARLLQYTGDAAEAANVLESAIGVAGETQPRVATALLIELLVELGRIDAANIAMERLANPSAPSERLLSARALAAVGRYEEALNTVLPAITPDESGVTPLQNDPNELDAVVLAAEIAWRLGDPTIVEQWAQRAIEIDPTYEAAYARLIDLYVRNGPLADSEKLSEVVRSLRMADPSSRTLRWLRAQELVAAGQYDQAERDLISLAEEDPSEPVVTLLTTLWLRTGSAARAEEWLRSQMEAHPSASAPVLALSRLLATEERAEEAVTLLEEWLAERAYDQSAARELETILREDLSRVKVADELALKRLELQPPSLARAIELSDVLVRLGQAERAAEELLNEVRTASAFPTSLVRPFFNAILLLGQAAMEDQVSIEPIVDLFEFASARFPQAPVEIYEQQMNVLAKANAPYTAVTRVLDRAMAQHRNRANDLAYVALVRFITFERPDLALQVADHLYEQIIEVEPRFFRAWLVAASQDVNTDSAVRALRATATHSVTSEVLRLFGQQPTGTIDHMNAELAMLIGDQFAAAEAPFEDVVRIYDLGLSFDPGHETLNNNYGYYLAVQGQRLNEAETLVLRALAGRPDDPFAMDSLGWVLYRRGDLYDRIGPDGEVEHEGAITVLERAAAMAFNRSSAEVQDHFGDALWAAGQQQRAEGRWRATEALLEEQIDTLNRQLNQFQAARDQRVAAAEAALNQAQSDLEKVRAKLAAVRQGEAPEIGEILGPINHPEGAATP